MIIHCFGWVNPPSITPRWSSAPPFVKPRHHGSILTLIFTVFLTMAGVAGAIETDSISCLAPVSQGHGEIDTSSVSQIITIPSFGALIAAAKGFFVAYPDNGEVHIDRVGDITGSGLVQYLPFPRVGLLAITNSGAFWAHFDDGKIVIEETRIAYPQLWSQFRTIRLPGTAGVYLTFTHKSAGITAGRGWRSGRA